MQKKRKIGVHPMKREMEEKNIVTLNCREQAIPHRKPNGVGLAPSPKMMYVLFRSVSVQNEWRQIFGALN